MPEDRTDVTKAAAGNEQAPDQSKVVTEAQQESEDQQKSVSGAAFTKAVSRLTAEKWDLKRQLKDREDELTRLKASTPRKTEDSKTEQEYAHLLGDQNEEKQPDESQSDIDARIARLENQDRLHQAADQLQELAQTYPDVDPDEVLSALEKDGKDESYMKLYFEAVRGRHADEIRAQRDAKIAAVEVEVASKSTEGPSRSPGTFRKDLFDDIPDDVEAIKAYREAKRAGKTP